MRVALTLILIATLVATVAGGTGKSWAQTSGQNDFLTDPPGGPAENPNDEYNKLLGEPPGDLDEVGGSTPSTKSTPPQLAPTTAKPWETREGLESAAQQVLQQGGSIYNRAARREPGRDIFYDPPQGGSTRVVERQMPAPHPRVQNGHHANPGHGDLQRAILAKKPGFGAYGLTAKSYVDARDKKVSGEIRQDLSKEKADRELAITKEAETRQRADAELTKKAETDGATLLTIVGLIIVGILAACLWK